ncbi:MAG: hypothetical protein ACOC05_06160, partial [Oceanicaulis sp.]
MNGFTFGALGAVVAISLVSLVLFAMREAIRSWLTSGIKHQYDKEIQRLEHQQQKSASELSAIRDGTLDALRQRDFKIFELRIEAIRSVWTSVQMLNAGRNVATMFRSLDFKKVLETADTDPKMKKLFESFSKAAGEPKDLNVPANSYKPFLPEAILARFEAYHGIITYYVLAAKAGELGLSSSIKEPDELITKTKFIFPHLSEMLDEHRVKMLPIVLPFLEQEIIS